MQVGVIAAAITFMFLNLDALYRPVANCSLVPQGVSEQSGGQPFASNVFEAKAVILKGLSIFVVGPARKHPPTPWTLSDEGPEFVLQICHRLDPRGDRPF